MNLIPFVVIWAVLALVVLALALYRNLAAMHEDALIHLGPGEERLVPKQVALFHRLDLVDRWGKTLTVVTLAGGVTLAAVVLYRAW
jgi:hypothetical protein